MSCRAVARCRRPMSGTWELRSARCRSLPKDFIRWKKRSKVASHREQKAGEKVREKLAHIWQYWGGMTQPLRQGLEPHRWQPGSAFARRGGAVAWCSGLQGAVIGRFALAGSRRESRAPSRGGKVMVSRVTRCATARADTRTGLRPGLCMQLCDTLLRDYNITQQDILQRAARAARAQTVSTYE